MEYRDQGYAGKSVPAEWLVRGEARVRKTRAEGLRSIGEDRGKKRCGMETARYPCDISHVVVGSGSLLGLVRNVNPMDLVGRRRTSSRHIVVKKLFTSTFSLGSLTARIRSMRNIYNNIYCIIIIILTIY